MFLQVLVVLGATNHAEVVSGSSREMLGVVSHTLHTGDLTAGLRLCSDGLLCGNHGRAASEFIYEHAEGAEAVAGMGVGPAGIHDDVGDQN